MRNPIKSVLRQISDYRLHYLRANVCSILHLDKPNDFTKSESAFNILQLRYPPRPEYGYDAYSLFKRAIDRADVVLRQPGLSSPGLKGLDIGAGDGMLGIMLQCFGHQMTLGDIEDWRIDAAKELPLITADFCNQIPLPDETFDFIVSFNSFEHFSNPAHVMDEILRMIRPGGLMYFDFNPLYCSPWGLHAYRSLRMPYPQFLFSESFIHEKLDQIGVWDLGKRRSELQMLNRWKPSQFEAIWKRNGIEIISCHWSKNEKHLDLVSEFPECFWGRGLKLEDLVYESVTVIIKKL